MYEVIYTRLKTLGCIRSPEYLSFGISYESMVVVVDYRVAFFISYSLIYTLILSLIICPSLSLLSWFFLILPSYLSLSLYFFCLTFLPAVFLSPSLPIFHSLFVFLLSLSLSFLLSFSLWLSLSLILPLTIPLSLPQLWQIDERPRGAHQRVLPRTRCAPWWQGPHLPLLPACQGLLRLRTPGGGCAYPRGSDRCVRVCVFTWLCVLPCYDVQV